MESVFGKYITRVESGIASQLTFSTMFQTKRLHSFYIDNSSEIINTAMNHACNLSM